MRIRPLRRGACQFPLDSHIPDSYLNSTENLDDKLKKIKYFSSSVSKCMELPYRFGDVEAISVADDSFFVTRPIYIPRVDSVQVQMHRGNSGEGGESY